MANPNNQDVQNLIGLATQMPQAIVKAVKQAADRASELLGAALYEWVEQGTETVGEAVTPIANHPVVQMVTKLPGASWLMSALGQVNVEKVQQDVAALQAKHYQDTQAELAQRVVADTVWQAAGIGLVTNLIPPLALTLLAVDLGAVAALQAEMIYRIAVIYGFSPTQTARRGEVMAIWAVAMGTSSVMKAGLSVVEIVPAVGAIVGTAGNAALLYSLGQVACQFYETKRRDV